MNRAGAAPACATATGQLFDPQLNIKQVNEKLYLQKLNSEVSDQAVYLKAARMGGGIYMHLPYFMPVGACQQGAFEVSARHILWNGKWYSGAVSFPFAAAAGESVFFTNEAAPVIKGASYFDASISPVVQERSTEAFGKAISFYQDVLQADPMRGVGSVVAIVRNEGKYAGFGGDSLNIIRMSYDNPSAANLATLDQVFPSTFAHELAHKLQSEALFAQPLARHIVEGGADFLKVIVMRGAGLIDEDQARGIVRKAAPACTAFADDRLLRVKAEQRKFNFREPYDCGLIYYSVAYFSSGLSGADFVAILRNALAGESDYGDAQNSLCLLFETSCRSKRLNAVAGSKAGYLLQMAWLEGQLATRPMPLLKQRLPVSANITR